MTIGAICRSLFVGPVFVDLIPAKAADGMDVFETHETGSAGRAFVGALQCGRVPSYAKSLPPIPVPVPPGLKTFLTSFLRDGIDATNAHYYSDVPAKIPAPLEPFFNAIQGHCLRFEDRRIQEFFAYLFNHIQAYSVGTVVKLALDDLFHGHLFAFVNASDRSRDDLGIVFHAKEYPRDYPGTFTGLDPRKEASTRSTDKDYHLRNYVWLMSTNQIVRLDPKHADFPQGLVVSGKEQFFTVSDDAFSSSDLGTLNYLPDLGLAVSPRHGFPADLRISYAESDTQVAKIISKLDREEANELLDLIRQPDLSPKRSARIEPSRRESVYLSAVSRLQEIEATRKRNFDKALNALVRLGYDLLDAHRALQQTKTGDVAYSVLRAEEILRK